MLKIVISVAAIAFFVIPVLGIDAAVFANVVDQINLAMAIAK